MSKPRAAPPARTPRTAPAKDRPVHRMAGLGWRGWARLLRRALAEMISDRVSLAAAGCAFYATLALFPAITMLVFIYGMAFDPATAAPQLELLHPLLPDEAFQLIAERVRALVTQPPSRLGAGLVISTAVAFWSSAAGTKGLLSALNLAHKRPETRGFLRFQGLALAMTLGAIVVAVLSLAVLVGLPAVLSFVGLSSNQGGWIRLVGMAMLVAFVLLGLSILYSLGPSRPAPAWPWVAPGAALATLLWLAASELFTVYVGRVASYDATYGPLGAVVGVMMWFYVTVYVVLLGGELNAVLERRVPPI